MHRLKHRRLHCKAMFDRLFREGERKRGDHLTLRVYRPDPSDLSRVGFVLRKKMGDAVKRNKYRRWLREIFRQGLPDLGESIWVLFDVPILAGKVGKKEFLAEAHRLFSALSLEGGRS